MRDHGKCIKCRRCVSVCAETQHVGRLSPQSRGFDTVIGPAFNRDLTTVACVQCGQCAAVCPVGAITEQAQIDEVWEALDDPEQARRGADGAGDPRGAGRVLRLPARHAGDRQDGRRAAPTWLRRRVRHELRRRPDDPGRRHGTAHAAAQGAGRQRTCRPADVHQLLAGLDQVRRVLPSRDAAEPLDLQVAAADVRRGGQDLLRREAGQEARADLRRPVMPCTAKKFECQRPEMGASGGRDVDVVLTTRELGKMIRAAGIDFRELPDEQMDAPAGTLHRRRRHLRQHRRRDGSGPPHGLRDRHRPPAAHGEPARRAHRGPERREGSVAEDRAGRSPTGRSSKASNCNVAVAHGLGNAQQLIGAVVCRREAVSLHRSDDLPRRLHRRRRPAALHRQQRAKGPHRRHLPRRRRQETPQVAREPRRRQALRGIPRPTAGRKIAPPAAHQVPRAQPGVGRGGCGLNGFTRRTLPPGQQWDAKCPQRETDARQQQQLRHFLPEAEPHLAFAVDAAHQHAQQPEPQRADAGSEQDLGAMQGRDSGKLNQHQGDDQKQHGRGRTDPVLVHLKHAQVSVRIELAEHRRVVRRVLPVGRRQHAGHDDQQRDEHGEETSQSARYIRMLDARAAELHHRTPLIRRTQTNHSTIQSVHQRVGHEPQADCHPGTVEVLQQVGRLVKPQHIQRTRVFADEEEDHAPAQRGQVGTGLAPQQYDHEERQQRVDRLHHEERRHRDQLIRQYRLPERQAPTTPSPDRQRSNSSAVLERDAANPLLDAAAHVPHVRPLLTGAAGAATKRLFQPTSSISNSVLSRSAAGMSWQPIAAASWSCGQFTAPSRCPAAKSLREIECRPTRLPCLGCRSNCLACQGVTVAAPASRTP